MIQRSQPKQKRLVYQGQDHAQETWLFRHRRRDPHGLAVGQRIAAPGTCRGQDQGAGARGEAIYLDNRGPNKAITYVYQRDPTEVIYLPGPLPPALVENETMQITAAGILKVNQETDQAWAEDQVH